MKFLLSTTTGAALMLGSAMAQTTVTNTSSTADGRPLFFNSTCTAETMTTRKEWRNMADDEKKAYIDAELCLMNLPAESGLEATTSRFSDLQAAHRYYGNYSDQGDVIHNVGQFLPWHRLFLSAHMQLLEEQCNYTGTMPWWDERKDADSGNFFQSNMWDDDTGFGGTGNADDNYCLTTGPFANQTEHMGPLFTFTDYCLARNWNNDLGVELCSSEVVNACYELNDYTEFFPCVIPPHNMGHAAVGGLMVDVPPSPGEPLFYLHHNYIDRTWWQWQTANYTSRLWDMNGNSVNESVIAEPAGGYVNASLDTVIEMADIVPSVTIRDLMNIQGGYLCYEFDY